MKRATLIVAGAVGVAIAVGMFSYAWEARVQAEQSRKNLEHYQATREKLKKECDSVADDPALLAEVAIHKAALAELLELRNKYNEVKQGADGTDDLANAVRDYAIRALSASDRHTAFVGGEMERRIDQLDTSARELTSALDPIAGPTALCRLKNPNEQLCEQMFKQWTETVKADGKWTQAKMVAQLIEPLDELSEELQGVCRIALPAIKARKARGESITDEIRLEEFTNAASVALATASER